MTRADSQAALTHTQASLRSGALCLRAPEPADAAAIYASAIASMGTVGVWMAWCHPDIVVADIAHWIGDAHAARQLHRGRNLAEAYEFVIIDEASGEHLGNCGLNHVDATNRIANLGYWVAQPHQGRGIATQAARLLLDFGFDQLGLRRIEVVVAVGNAPSLSVVQTLAHERGGVDEGVRGQRVSMGADNTDAHMYAFFPARAATTATDAQARTTHR